ncbi:phage tail tape measure protein [Acinetobacter bereziniae]|uniref:phage tail tape measure protein n=1 Tax=Acinetobacter bereziniae TaxID=106648 RepID=UPI0035314A57
MVALGFKTDNTGLGQMQDAMGGIELKAVALKSALFALATGAVVAVRQTASELDKLYFSSQRIGASATNITAFGNAISQMGGNAESAIGTLENLAEKMRNSPGYEGMINSLGVNTKQANGEMRDRVDVMKDLSGVLAQMPAYQANAYANSLGIDQNTLLAMRDGKFVSNMEKYQKIQEQLGMNDELTKSGNEFMTEYRDLTMVTKTGFQVIVMQAGKALIPILRLLNQLIQVGISAFSQLNPEIKQMLGVGLRFAMLGLVFGGFIKTFGMIFKFIPMIKSFIGVLKLFRLAFLASPIGIILALATALALLYDDYKTWRDGGKSLFDWSKWTNGIETIINKIKDFLDLLDKIKDKVINFVQKIISDPVGAVQEVVETTKEVLSNVGDELANPTPDENGKVSAPRDAIAYGMDAGFGAIDKGLAFFGDKDAQERVNQRERGEIGYQSQPKIETPKNAKDLANFAENAPQPNKPIAQLPNSVEKPQPNKAQSSQSIKNEKPQNKTAFSDGVKSVTQKGIDAIVNVATMAQNVVKDTVSNTSQYSFSFGKDVDNYIKEASVKYGIDEKVLRGFVKMEAGWTGKMSPTGAIGTGQFIQPTWDGLAKTKEGQEIGMTKIGKRFKTAKDPRFDKRINTLATGLLAKQNADILIKNGLPVTGENLYLLHNVGAGIIPAIKGSNKVSRATLEAIKVNTPIKGQSPKQFVAYQKGVFNDHYKVANAIKKDVTPNNSKNRNSKIPNIKNMSPPVNNPNKEQINQSNANSKVSQVTIHQEYKTEMTINGARDPQASAQAVKKNQENANVFLARSAKGVLP